MRFEDIYELHYICLVRLIPSILNLGILSHNEARRLRIPSISDPLIQAKRANKTIPNAGRLHDYANLYFHARNPMMCKIQERHDELCILRVNREILLLPNVIIADGNASSDYTLFGPSPLGLRHLDKNLVYARDWRDSDQISYYRRKRIRCAEVLVPKLVPASYIIGAHVCSSNSADLANQLVQEINVTMEPDLFII